MMFRIHWSFWDKNSGVTHHFKKGKPFSTINFSRENSIILTKFSNIMLNHQGKSKHQPPILRVFVPCFQDQASTPSAWRRPGSPPARRRWPKRGLSSQGHASGDTPRRRRLSCRGSVGWKKTRSKVDSLIVGVIFGLMLVDVG